LTASTVVSSDDAIAFDAVPPRLVVVGGGAIGLELGSVWSRLGSEVTVVEFLPKIVANYDDDIVRNFTRLLQKQGLKIEVGAKVTGLRQAACSPPNATARSSSSPPTRCSSPSAAAPSPTASASTRPASSSTRRSASRSTPGSAPPAPKNIWAIGDVVAGPMLAHKAEEDGVAVAEWIAGKAGHINWDLVPASFTPTPRSPASASARTPPRRGLAVKVGRFNFAANGRAIAAGHRRLRQDHRRRQDRSILGAQILGANAGELISEVVTHMEYGGSAEDLARTIHAHPTLSEAVKEAEAP
jgi:dihydrolipoamide dehydrogenase